MHIFENIMTWICVLILVLMVFIAVGSTFCRSVDAVRLLSDVELLARYRFLKNEVGADLSSSEFVEVLNEIRRRGLTVED